MRLGVKGRKETFSLLKSGLKNDDKTIWFHCASLGEYEQGLPIFEEIKKDHPNHKIILSFFSPSGFQVRKNSPIADLVVYLPLDTKKNAELFIELVHPELVIFVKYEIWPNYMKVLNHYKIRTLLISALFRDDQIHFKWYGKLMRKALGSFEHIFVQNQSSKDKIESIGMDHVTVSGDTRFDRVAQQLKIDNSLPSIDSFKQNKVCIVCGSTWPEDDHLLVEYINSTSQEAKFIIAPHNIKPKHIAELQVRIQKQSVIYSEIDDQDVSLYQVLIIDSIGLLSQIYSYADIAYVGGAIGTTGLHNTLEPAVFGIPIIIGNNHSKFPEAKQLIARGGIFSIKNSIELNTNLDKLLDNEAFRVKSGNNCRAFIEENKGAVIQIMNYIRK